MTEAQTLQAALMQTRMIVQMRERINEGNGWGPLIDYVMTVERARDMRAAERERLISRCGTDKPRAGLFWFRTFPGEEWIFNWIGDPVQVLLAGFARKA